MSRLEIGDEVIAQISAHSSVYGKVVAHQSVTEVVVAVEDEDGPTGEIAVISTHYVRPADDPAQEA